MENQKFASFVVLCAVFLCLCAGVFAGRNVPGSIPALVPAAVEEVSSLIDLNQADAAALMTLPGIGRTLAARILEYRVQNGPFTSLSQLLNINGLGEARLEALLPYITAGGS